MPTLAHIVRTYDHSSTRHRRTWLYTGPVSYVTGGDALTASDVKLGEIEAVVGGEVASNGSVILLLFYDHTNQKMKWFDLAGAEVAGATDLSAYSSRLTVEGRG